MSVLRVVAKCHSYWLQKCWQLQHLLLALLGLLGAMPWIVTAWREPANATRRQKGLQLHQDVCTPRRLRLGYF